MAKKQKLDLTPTGASLSNPFASLEIAGLPPGQATPAPSPAEPRPSKFGRVVLRREKAHRGGKTVIVIDDFAPNIGYNYIESLAGQTQSRLRLRRHGERPHHRNPGRPTRPHPRTARSRRLSRRRRHLTQIFHDTHYQRGNAQAQGARPDTRTHVQSRQGRPERRLCQKRG